MDNRGKRNRSVIPGQENLFQQSNASASEIGELYAMHSEWQSMRQILEVLFNHNSDPISIIDPQYKIIAANNAFYQKCALNEEIIGTHCYEATHNRSEPCGPPHHCPLIQTLRSGTYASATHTHYNSSGDEIFVEVATSPIRNKQGEIIHVIHTTRDITEKVVAEETLKQIKVQHQRTVDILPLTAIIHLQGNILFANAAAAKMLGAGSPDELLGKEIMGFFHQEAVAALEERFQWALDGELVPPFEVKLIRLDGKEIYFEIINSSLTYRGQQALLLAGSDITERKKVELERLEANNRLARMEKLASLGTMAAGIAHEVVQPLNALKVTVDGMLYWLNRGQSLDVARVSENLKKVSVQADRINEIIKHVQSLIHTQQDNALYLCSLNKVVENSLNVIGNQLAAHGIKINKNLSPGLPPVPGIESRLEQVMINLLMNGMQALDAVEQPLKEITIYTNPELEQVVLEVRDNGLGIGENINEKIFEPFFTTKPMGDSMGLGLTIVSSIVSSFSGKISVINNEGGGATFRIVFPVGNGKL